MHHDGAGGGSASALPYPATGGRVPGYLHGVQSLLRPTTAAIYVRVSSTGQAEEELPIESQLERCQERAAALGATVLQVFVEPGRSARTDARPEFQACIAFCERSRPTYLIAWSTSRFARHTVDAGNYKERLARAGVDLVYVSFPLDRNTDAGWLTEKQMEIFDELSSRLTAADTKRSMISNALAGRWNGGRPPYGYASAPDGRRRRLAVVDAEAAIARDIYTWRLQGLGTRAIAMRLNGAGLTNRSRRWTKSAVSALLRNEALNGMMIFNRKNRRTGARRPRDEWIVVDSHEGIIDRDIWQTVQQMMTAETNTNAHGSPLSRWLFTGLLRCGQCGSAMQIETAKGRSKRYSYYNCSSAQKTGGCAHRRLPAAEMDQWLTQLITDKVLTSDVLLEVLNELSTAAQDWERDSKARRKLIHGQMKDARLRRARLYDVLELHGRDAPNLGDLTERLRDLNGTVRRLESELVVLEAERAPAPDIGPGEITELCEFLLASLTAGDPARARQFFQGFVDSIKVRDDAVEVHYNPALLVRGRPDGVVHSMGNWLPGRDLLGTGGMRRIVQELPERFRRRVA